jgi:hypothetical protein
LVYVTVRLFCYKVDFKNRFENANTKLIEHLGEANWQRLVRIRKQINAGLPENYPDAITIFKPYSIFHNLGIRMLTAITTVTSYLSFLSGVSGDSQGCPQVPHIPHEADNGRPFLCEYCKIWVIIKNYIK